MTETLTMAQNFYELSRQMFMRPVKEWDEFLPRLQWIVDMNQNMGGPHNDGSFDEETWTMSRDFVQELRELHFKVKATFP